MFALRKALNLNMLISYRNTYSMGLFVPSQSKSHKQNDGYQQSGRLLDKINLETKDSKAAEQVNKYFQGIRMNTKYAKFYNQYSVKKIQTIQEPRKISDLPFRHQKQQNTTTTVQGQNNTLCQHFLNKIDSKNLNNKITQMCYGFFIDLFENKRTVKLQPNFQKQARITVATLIKNGYKFKIQKNNDITFKIKNTQLYRGIQVTRNNNYSIDSYQVLKQIHYTYYKLWQKGSYKIPEQQWKTQRNLLMRLVVKSKSPYSITITKQNNQSIVLDAPRTFVFEMDLKHPPRFAQYHSNQKQYLQKYRPVLDNLTITNVDYKNPYAAFTYEQREKKNRLINKLVD